jgi:hypothetical protein
VDQGKDLIPYALKHKPIIWKIRGTCWFKYEIKLHPFKHIHIKTNKKQTHSHKNKQKTTQVMLIKQWKMTKIRIIYFRIFLMSIKYIPKPL